MFDSQDPKAAYLVLINSEGQYSLWPKIKPVPAGWEHTGPEGDKEICLKYIDEMWTDMRPISLQQRMKGD